jgi:hypothetical protein
VTFALRDTTPEKRSIPCNVTFETANLPGSTGAIEVEVMFRSGEEVEGLQAVRGCNSQLLVVGFQKTNP